MIPTESSIAAAYDANGEVAEVRSAGGMAGATDAQEAARITEDSDLLSSYKYSSIPASGSDDPSNRMDSVDAPTLVPAQAREIAAAFEKARLEQNNTIRFSDQDDIVKHHEMKDWRQYYMADWTPDRGSNIQARERVLYKRPALVATGRYAGLSQVKYTSTRMLSWHMWHRDFFLTLIHQSVSRLAFIICVVHLISFFFFSIPWYLVWRYNTDCLAGINGYVQVYIFSMVTQQTIGYGNSSPNNCAWAALLITVQTLWGLLLQAISLGVLFARISHPQQRARSIFMSETAVICRRDGILKLMFRIADIKVTQVIGATVRAYLYTWGSGRHTAEGEFIPVRSEELLLMNIDGLLLLPITIEHTIDERSPLCGHTFDSLVALNAEIVITFEGSTETGNPFMARQSYLANEIKWGYQFVRCIHRPHGSDTQYTVDTAKFHLIEPQVGIPRTDASTMSKAVVSKSKRTVPYPILGENTLVLSESMCLTEDDGNLCLMFRVGDTYPNQILDPIVRAYVYRWTDNPTSKQNDYTVSELDIGYDTGRDRLLLWLPVVVKHIINPSSPLTSWEKMSGFLADADSCIAVVVEGYMYSSSENRMRMRIYNCFNDVKLHHHFAHMVVAPTLSPDRKPRVDWTRFHATTMDTGVAPGQTSLGTLAPHQPGSKSGFRDGKSFAKRTDSSISAPSGSPGFLPMKQGVEEVESPSSMSHTMASSEEFESSAMTYEGGQLSSMLPHLNPQSTFNRREGQLLALERLNRDTAGPDPGRSSPVNPGRGSSVTAPSVRAHSQRASLPAAWRGLRASSTLHTAPGAALQSRVSLVPE